LVGFIEYKKKDRERTAMYPDIVFMFMYR